MKKAEHRKLGSGQFPASLQTDTDTERLGMLTNRRTSCSVVQRPYCTLEWRKITGSFAKCINN